MYVEMDRMDDDLTNLLFHRLSRKILDGDVLDGNITQIESDQLMNLYENMINGFIDYPSIRIMYHELNDEMLPLVTDNIALESLLNDEDFDKKKSEYGFTPYHTKENVRSIIDNLVQIRTRFGTYTVTEAMYQTFMNKFKSALELMIPEVIKQMTMIEIILSNNKYAYLDIKYDNFGYVLEDKKRTHFGIDWNGNMFDNRYFYVYALDWESGLSKIDDGDTPYYWRLEDLYNIKMPIKIHVDFDMNRLQSPLINYPPVNLANLAQLIPQGVIDIITYPRHWFYIEFKDRDFKNLDEIKKDIMRTA